MSIKRDNSYKENSGYIDRIHSHTAGLRESIFPVWKFEKNILHLCYLSYTWFLWYLLFTSQLPWCIHEVSNTLCFNLHLCDSWNGSEESHRDRSDKHHSYSRHVTSAPDLWSSPIHFLKCSEVSTCFTRKGHRGFKNRTKSKGMPGTGAGGTPPHRGETRYKTSKHTSCFLL